MTSHLVNFPRLHEELTQGPKPENVLFLASALFDAPPAPSLPLVEAIQSALPLPIKEARRKARQLQDFGADLWDSRQLETLAAMSQSKASQEREQSSELQEIKNFIVSQGLSQDTNNISSGNTSIENIRMSKELALCIVYELEQAILDTQAAIEKLGAADAAFRVSLHATNHLKADLHDDDLTDILATVPGLATFASSPDITLPYRTVLEAILPFLPEETILFSNDNNVLEDLHETGVLGDIPSSPLQGQEQFRLVHIPAWRLLHHKKANPELPWTTQNVYFCYPNPATP